MQRRVGWGSKTFGPILLVLAVGACEPAQTSEPEVRPVHVATVRLEPAEDVIRYAAVIRPRVEADLGFRIGGKVVQRLVEVGARVEAGQPLAKLDPADIELQVRVAVAQLASAKADAVNAK
ncbi:MAG TPA: biotin/lipoyl-binding protein, partial [Azospirillaceae bacterium]|nr:biotin/lipoyl-binding protein [Azospirillaceae bacterium]